LDAKTIRDTALGADDLGFKFLNVPEWKVNLYIKKLMASERESWEEHTEKAKYKKTRERLVVATCFDADHKQVFSLADMEALSQKSAKAIDRIFDCALALNGMRKKDLEEAEANFDEAAQPPSNSD
jgi:hypothetical protein